jgi:hypothetical protein
MVYAAHVAVLQKPDDKGFAQRAHVQGLVRRGQATEAQRRLLEGPPFPDSLDYLWEWFCELARTRTVGMAGVDPLTYPDVDAWARLTDRQPAPEEVEALLDLDAVMRHPERLTKPDEVRG